MKSVFSRTLSPPSETKVPKKHPSAMRKREGYRADGDVVDDGLRQPLAEKPVDDGPDAGDERNEPEIFTHNSKLAIGE